MGDWHVNKNYFIGPAVEALSDGSPYILRENNEGWEIEWLDSLAENPSNDEIESKAEELFQQWTATEYQRLRRPKYPPLADFADAMYWQSKGDNSKMDAYLAAIDAIKAKYPKE
jgi:hypothetical protein